MYSSFNSRVKEGCDEFVKTANDLLQELKYNPIVGSAMLQARINLETSRNIDDARIARKRTRVSDMVELVEGE